MTEENTLDYDALLDRLHKGLPQETKDDIRFEVPPVQSNIQGNRTIIYNFSEIANILHREISHVLKYLLKELGTAGDVDGHRVILQGRFNTPLISKRVDNYVSEFVTCSECGKPDTQFIREERVRLLKCMACGARHPIRNI